MTVFNPNGAEAMRELNASLPEDKKQDDDYFSELEYESALESGLLPFSQELIEFFEKMPEEDKKDILIWEQSTQLAEPSAVALSEPEIHEDGQGNNFRRYKQTDWTALQKFDYKNLQRLKTFRTQNMTIEDLNQELLYLDAKFDLERLNASVSMLGARAYDRSESDDAKTVQLDWLESVESASNTHTKPRNPVVNTQNGQGGYHVL